MVKATTDHKTNAMRALDAAHIPHQTICFETSHALSGVEVAALLEQDPDQVFKTLVTVGKSGANYVFLIPVADCQQFVGEVLAKSLAVERSFPERAGGISEGGEPGNYRVDSAAEFIGVGVGAEEKAALGGDYFSHSSDIGADGGNAVTERLADHNRTPLRTATQKQ